MTAATHSNDVPQFTLTPEELEQVFARTTEAQAAQKAAREHAEQWPGQVEQTLLSLARELVALRVRVAELEGAEHPFG